LKKGRIYDRLFHGAVDHIADKEGEFYMKKNEACHFQGAEFFYVDSPSWQYSRRWGIPSSCLIFVIYGNLYMELEGVRYTVTDQEFLFMPGGSKSRGYRASDKPTAFYNVLFMTEESPEFPAHFTVGDTTDIRAMLTLISSISRNKEYDTDIKNSLLKALLYEVYYQYTHGDTNQASEASPVVDRMKNYIKNSLYRNLTRQDVANHFGFSVVHTQRLFAREMHMSLKAYINEMRIKRIEEHLMARNISLRSLAEKFDFPSVDALNKYFKYHTGKTIKEFQSKFLS